MKHARTWDPTETKSKNYEYTKGRDKWKTENIFNGVITENFPNLGR
jgi:hypothetical protein